MTTSSDQAQIRVLKHRYCRFLDTKQWSEYGELFTPDAVMDVRDDVPEELGDGIVKGRAAIVEQVHRFVGAARTVHQVHEPEISLTSATTAEGIWGMHDVVIWPEGVAAPTPFRSLRGYGYYYETYQLSNGRWQISTLKLSRLHVDMA
jgi:hypothetical protein